MGSYCISFLLVFSILITHVMGEIKKTGDLTPIFEALQEADDQTLVVFDVHDVLTVPSDQILRKPYKKRLKECLAEVAALQGNEEASMLESIVKQQHRVDLVDPRMAQLVRDLKERHIPALALTNAWTGEGRGSCAHEDHVLAQLHAVGIDFSTSFPSVGSMSLECSKRTTVEGLALFKKGVIFTCGLPKGHMLKAFLERVAMRPSHIVFVDDKLTNLESVESFCQEALIPFLGFQYTASVKTPSVHFQEKRSELQLMMLKTEKRWIGDDEANQMLKLELLPILHSELPD